MAARNPEPGVEESDDAWFFNPDDWFDTARGNIARDVDRAAGDVRVVIYGPKPSYGWLFILDDNERLFSKIWYKTKEDAMRGALINLWKL